VVKEERGRVEMRDLKGTERRKSFCTETNENVEKSPCSGTRQGARPYGRLLGPKLSPILWVGAHARARPSVRHTARVPIRGSFVDNYRVRIPDAGYSD
jgi:hypothetical protein